MSLTPREHAEIEAALGLAAEPVTPSPELKANLMAKIAETPQLPAGETDAGGPAHARAQSRWFSRPVAVVAAAAAAVLLFAGGTVVGLQISGTSATDVEAQSLAGLTAASDLHRSSAEIAGGGEATLIWSPHQRKSAILVNDLPPLASDKTYQLWYIGDEGAIPAGVFTANVSATSWRVLDGAMTAGDTVGVTVEPAGGSAKPSTDPILTISSS